MFHGYRRPVEKTALYRHCFFIVTVLVLIADQLSVVGYLKLAPCFWPLVPDIFHLTYVQTLALLLESCPINFLLLLFHLMILFIAFSGRFIDTRYALMRLARCHRRADYLAILLTACGQGYVVNFLDFRFWPMFNLGDTAIFLGVALLFINLLCGTKFSPRDNKGKG